MRIRMRSAEVMGGNTRNWLISADDWRSQNHRCVIILDFFFYFFFFFKQEERNDGKQHVALVERRCPRRGIQEADHSEERERREVTSPFERAPLLSTKGKKNFLEMN